MHNATILAHVGTTMTISLNGVTARVHVLLDGRWHLVPGQLEALPVRDRDPLFNIEQAANDFTRFFDIPPMLAPLPAHCADYVSVVGLSVAWRYRMAAATGYVTPSQSETLTRYAKAMGFPATQIGIAQFLGAR